MRCAFVPVTVHAVCSCPSRSSAVSTVRAGSRAWRAGGAAAAARLLPRQAAVEPRAAPLGVHMLSSNELRPGVTVEMDGSVWRVTEFLHVKPGKGAAFVRTKLKNMETGAALEKTFKVWCLLRLHPVRALALAGGGGGSGTCHGVPVQGLLFLSASVVVWYFYVGLVVVSACLPTLGVLPSCYCAFSYSCLSTSSTIDHCRLARV